jgi:hypothetical protein
MGQFGPQDLAKIENRPEIGLELAENFHNSNKWLQKTE